MNNLANGMFYKKNGARVVSESPNFIVNKFSFIYLFF